MRDSMRARDWKRSNVVVADDISVGHHSRLWAPRELRMGRDVHIGSFVRIEVDGEIGNSVLIANGVGIIGRHDHRSEVGVPITKSAWVGEYPDTMSYPVRVGSDVWIGYGATILSGVSIGTGCIIGARALVVKDVAPNSIVVGSPARVHGLRFTPDEWSAHLAALRRASVLTAMDEVMLRGK